MNELILVLVALAAILGALYLVNYLAGPLLVGKLNDTKSLPGRLASELPSGSPPTVVLGGNALGSNLSGGSGPPGYRRLLLSDTVIDEHEDELGTVSALSVALLDTYAYDVRILANLLRIELLFGIVAFALHAAQTDLFRSLSAALAVVIGIIVGALVVFYGLYRLVAWRVYRADERAATYVGAENIITYLESNHGRTESLLSAVVHLSPPTKTRIDRLERAR
ncbi:hypothetical protein ZOD2009_19198 [Haladaptatus paucihalophilus DX253]|uniref:Uncharacterized protein n=1 Tax=Haladaptatus paucihalophilus DX253 TaxID=797209 RepID=E7QYE9_HALPU|nr:hypothetical protein [Haladaptatus paucihalophilus]EFW90215.1 hypothetical protein ZOD2009_19198 [Haladaptatus paucihalophilus DX253]SHJ98317.1 hypothetical protein SAMN05444342_0163 [Haladaptatus paucihalophilus DX253]